MGLKKCYYRGCKANELDREVKLFNFPWTAPQRERYRLWAEIADNPRLISINDDGSVKYQRAYLCTRHFDRSQFTDDRKVKLLRGAVPSRNAWCPSSDRSLGLSTIPHLPSPTSYSCLALSDTSEGKNVSRKKSSSVVIDLPSDNNSKDDSLLILQRSVENRCTNSPHIVTLANEQTSKSVTDKNFEKVTYEENVNKSNFTPEIIAVNSVVNDDLEMDYFSESDPESDDNYPDIYTLLFCDQEELNRNETGSLLCSEPDNLVKSVQNYILYSKPKDHTENTEVDTFLHSETEKSTENTSFSIQPKKPAENTKVCLLYSEPMEQIKNTAVSEPRKPTRSTERKIPTESTEPKKATENTEICIFYSEPKEQIENTMDVTFIDSESMKPAASSEINTIMYSKPKKLVKKAEISRSYSESEKITVITKNSNVISGNQGNENPEITKSSKVAPNNVRWESLPEEFCRLCATKVQQPKQSIRNCLHLLKEIIPTMVSLDDGLPQYICESCFEKTCMANRIKQDFTASYEKLKNTNTSYAVNDYNLNSQLNEIVTISGNMELNNIISANSNSLGKDDDLHSQLNAFTVYCEFIDDASPIATHNSSSEKESGTVLTKDQITPLIARTGNDDWNKNFADISTEQIGSSFRCVCGLQFSTYRLLEIHRLNSCFQYKRKISDYYGLWHKRKTKLLCEVCGEQTKSLSGHMQKHRDEKKICEVCGKQVKCLNEHVKKHRIEKKTCKVCGKQVRDLNTHLLQHNNEKKENRTLLCEICGKQVKTLQSHLLAHSSEKNYLCKYCGLCFYKPKFLAQHVRSTHLKKKSSCNICSQYVVGSYAKHLFIHFNGKSKCDVCLMGFTRTLNRNIHQKTKCKECLCVVCRQTFADIQSLVDHRTEVHSEKEIMHAASKYWKERTYTCNICFKVLSSRHYVRKHTRSYHMRS